MKEWIVSAESLDDFENEGRFEIKQEFVRCGICEHNVEIDTLLSDGRKIHVFVCSRAHSTVPEDWYCGDGKRKEE